MAKEAGWFVQLKRLQKEYLKLIGKVRLVEVKLQTLLERKSK